MISRRPGAFGALKVTRNGLSKRLVQRVMLTLKTILTPTSRTERSLARQSYLPDLLKTSPRCEFLKKALQKAVTSSKRYTCVPQSAHF
ncbi:hypothetical protein RB195_015048 [Necator americanus]|uniref:Transposase n=1 Tax=Necator americanus TaxID=51031 RepID=A0ABR1E2R3_NECAM